MVPFQQSGCKWVLTALSLGHTIKWFAEATLLHSYVQHNCGYSCSPPIALLEAIFKWCLLAHEGGCCPVIMMGVLLDGSVGASLCPGEQRFIGYGTNWWPMTAILIAFTPGPHVLK